MITSANFGKLLEPGLRKIFFDSYDELSEQYRDVYDVRSSKKAKETDYHVAGLGTWQKRTSGTDPVQYEDIAPGTEVNYTHDEYVKGTQVERKFVDDEMYDVINKLPKEVGFGGRVSVEQNAAVTLINAFTVNGYDGVPLISASHPLYGNQGGICGNLWTGPMNDTNLRTGWTLMRKTKNEAGIRVQSVPKEIILPIDLEFTFSLLDKSAQTVGSGNNDFNIWKAKLKPVSLDYLASTSAYFLRDPRFDNLTFFWRVKPEFKREENFDTLVQKYRGYLRHSNGYSDWRGLGGSLGT